MHYHFLLSKLGPFCREYECAYRVIMLGPFCRPHDKVSFHCTALALHALHLALQHHAHCRCHCVGGYAAFHHFQCILHSLWNQIFSEIIKYWYQTQVLALADVYLKIKLNNCSGLRIFITLLKNCSSCHYACPVYNFTYLGHWSSHVQLFLCST